MIYVLFVGLAGRRYMLSAGIRQAEGNPLNKVS